MDNVRPKIELYHVRTFSQKISDTFDLIREAWRPLLKYSCYLLLPVCIVMAFFANNFYSGYLGVLVAATVDGNTPETSQLVRFGLSALGFGIVSCVAAVLLLGLVFTLLRLYRRRPERLSGLSSSEVKDELKHCALRATRLLLAWLLLGVLLSLLLGVVIVVLMSIDPTIGSLGILLLTALVGVALLPLSLSLPVYMMEDGVGVVEALLTSWRLGFATWGGIFAVSFVLSLIGMALQTVTFLPWYVLQFAQMLVTLQGGGEAFAGAGILQYLSCIWMCIGYVLVTIISLVGLTIQYGHASDKIDGTGLLQKIDQF